MDKTYLDELTSVLQKDERLVNEDGKLLKTKITEYAHNLDPALMELIVSNEKLKNFFFKKIKDVLIFDQDKFLTFVHNEAFLKDSFTAFKNEIGLAIDREDYITERNEVVLNWPYKDCVLEGGQDKEDQKRDEIFWNETLGADQRDVLLAPKVITGFKRHDKAGESKATELTEKDNLIIRGNNLLALHTLKKRYAGKVKLIYIDPPYNTGGDSFHYNDKFNHASWLTFMKNRLEAAKELLRDDGQVFIHIDHTEQAYLKVLCDQIFNRGNFVQIISVKTSTPSGVKVVNPGPVNVTEFVLNYAKNKSQVKFRHTYKQEYSYQKDYSSFILNKNDKSSEWNIKKVQDCVLEELGYSSKKELDDKVGKNTSKLIIENASLEFCIKNSNNVFATFGANKPSASLQQHIEKSKSNKEVIFEVAREDNDNYYLLNGRLLAFYSNKLKEIDGKRVPTRLVSDFWDDMSWDSVSLEGGVTLGNGKKPESFIKRIIELSTDKGDLVLDYHLGSGTTVAVAHKMGRGYIGIEQLQYGENDPTIRLQNVINGDQSGISKSAGWEGGGSFVYGYLMNDVNIFIKEVEKAKDVKEVESLRQTVLASNFLSHRVNPKKFEKEEFAKLPMRQQKSLLIDLVDKNKLYVNYHDIDDVAYSVDPDTKRINKWLQSRG